MSEHVPDSIPNNYDIYYHQPSEDVAGLLVAQSRANHAYTEHPHPLDELEAPAAEEHEKVRGIAYTETELAGKPFIIAERPGSKKRGHGPVVPPEAGSGTGPEPAAWPSGPDPNQTPTTQPLPTPLAEKAKRGPEGITKIQYKPDRYGNVRLATEYTRPDYVFDWTQDWSQGEHREVMIETEDGGKFFVKGGTAYDMEMSEEYYDRGIGMPASWVTENGEEFPKAVIGKEWKLAPDFVTGKVTKVVVGEGIAGASLLGEHGPIDADYAKRGRNPFENAEDLLRLLERQNEQNVSELPDRPSWAGEKLRGVAAALSAAKERMTERTRQMARHAKHAGRFTAEKLGDFTATVDYLGNIALIETAYHAGNAWGEAAYRAGNAGDRIWDVSNRIDDAGNDVLEGVATAAGVGAVVGGELAGRATRRVDFMGRVIMEHIAARGSQAAERAKKRLRSRRKGRKGAVGELDEDDDGTRSPEELDPDVLRRNGTWDELEGRE